MKLLVVDSDRDLVEMLTNWLRMYGHEVYRAYDMERAKAVWQEQQPDLVLIDTVLGEANVLKLCREVRNRHDALMMVITDGRDVHDEIRCLEGGADDYLRKPFFPAQLLARIHALSRRGRSTLAQRPSSIITVGPIRVDSLHSDDGDDWLIKAHIRHLRQKIEPDASEPTYILTVPSVGYTLVRHSSEDEKLSPKEVTRTLRAVSV